MITVKLLCDTRVNLETGRVIEVSEREAEKLIAFGQAEKTEIKKPAKRASKKQ